MLFETAQTVFWHGVVITDDLDSFLRTVVGHYWCPITVTLTVTDPVRQADVTNPLI